MAHLAAQQAVPAFPYPPEFFRQYTDENVANGRVLPPPPPIQGHLVLFGEEYNTEDEMIRSLGAQKMQQLYSSTADGRSELKKLNRSIMAAFLDLLDILVKCPDHPDRMEKINQLRLLFINMHHLINEYRPQQGRDTVRLMLQLQVQQINEITARFRKHLESARETLQRNADTLSLQVEESSRDPSPFPGARPISPILEDDNEEEMKKEECLSMATKSRTPLTGQLSKNRDKLLCLLTDE